MISRRSFIRSGALFVPTTFGILRGQMHGPIAPSVVAAGGGATYLIDEDFEGTGKPTDWVDSTGAGDYDYTTGPLEGAQSLFLDGTGTTTVVFSPTFTAQSTLWVHFMIKWSAQSAANVTTFGIRETNTLVAYLNFRSTAETVRVYNGTTQTATTGWVVGTTYHVWMKYVKGTGADGITEVYRSTTTTRGAALVTVTGNATSDLNNLYFQANTAQNFDVMVDQVLVDDAEIGDL